MDQDENPYRSPLSDTEEGGAIQLDGLGAIRVRSVHRGFAYRRIELDGAIRAVVEYQGARFGCELVLVNGQVTLRARNLGFALVPHLEFTICSETAQVVARIDVRGTLGVRAFRLAIAKEMVYSEGCW